MAHPPQQAPSHVLASICYSEHTGSQPYLEQDGLTSTQTSSVLLETWTGSEIGALPSSASLAWRSGWLKAHSESHLVVLTRPTLLINHVLKANDARDGPVLIDYFHAKVGFVIFLVVIQQLSRNLSCLLDRGTEIGELVTLVVPRPHPVVVSMKEVAGHSHVTVRSSDCSATQLIQLGGV
jgi:hypothetical protein